MEGGEPAAKRLRAEEAQEEEESEEDTAEGTADSENMGDSEEDNAISIEDRDAWDSEDFDHPLARFWDDDGPLSHTPEAQRRYREWVGRLGPRRQRDELLFGPIEPNALTPHLEHIHCHMCRMPYRVMDLGSICSRVMRENGSPVHACNFCLRFGNRRYHVAAQRRMRAGQ